MMLPFTRFKVADSSMEPTFKEGDLLLVNRLAYLFRGPRIGDVVVLKDHEMFLLKRVAAANGEKVYVVGDNAAQSRDSRDFGWVKKENIIGKVLHGDKKD